MIKVGIVGYGVIGSALGDWINSNNNNCKLYILDPYKGYNEDLSNVDIVFISIHIDTEENGVQNLSILEEIISKLPNKPIYIRTTILPGTSDTLSRKFCKDINFMPEFLTERTALDDFKNQKMVFTGSNENIELLKQIFIDKEYIVMSSLEAEIAKYAHNVFGALKVTYFNGIYDICKKNGCNFDNVQKGVLLSGYINDTHTYVPGPDGKCGYGGKCFPKDVNAFASFSNRNKYSIEKLIFEVQKLNDMFRKNI